jgi:GT2 family glycosyltransferase
MKPNVQVLVPVHNQPMFAIKCVQSVRGQSRLDPVRPILICDDGSDQDTQDALKAMDDVTVYRNVGAEGFVKSVNRLVKKSDAQYVLILNSDTEVLPKAIEYMANNLDDGAAVCGALLLYPQNHPVVQWRGRVQHAGVFYDTDGFPQHAFSHYHPQNKAVQTWRSINTVTGAAMMVKHEIWDKIGGFDNRFNKGVFEDCDLTLSIKKLKLEVIYEPKAILWHFEHASQSQADNWFSKENIERNLSYLFQKHGQPKEDSELFFKVR